MRRLFGTDGIRGKANAYPMTVDIALKVGKAAGLLFRNGHKKSKIVLGKDTRLSGYMIESALAAGLLSMGIDVYFVGPMPTPAIAHLTRSFAADAGVVISASHNPYEDNGIKFFDNAGFKLADEKEEKIEQLALSDLATDNIVGEDIGKAHRIDDARGRYIEFAKNSINNLSLKGLKVVVDCANGATYHITQYILAELGADVILKNYSPDGKNINFQCGALHPELLREDVLREKADAAIALDGDGDRLIMLDEQGSLVDGDGILAIAALDLLRSGKLSQNTLVATQYSNFGLMKTLERAGGKVVLTDVGDRYVLEEMRKHNYNLGGEQSGHIIFLDYSTTGDGTIAALQVMKIMKQQGKKLSELAGALERFPQVLVNVPVREKKPFAEMPAVLEAIRTIESQLGSDGRVFVRYSGTENKVRVMVEGKVKEEIEGYTNKIVDVLKKEIGAGGFGTRYL